MIQTFVRFLFTCATFFAIYQIPCTITVKLWYNGTADVEAKTLVVTKTGPIAGLITVREGLNISCYLGVPYAEPPIGERRFAEPMPIRAWKKTYNAVRQPPICYQREFKHFRPSSFLLVRELLKEDATIEEYYASERSEDCLYLSVFTRTGESMTVKNKTVLVWIHGGAFISGTGNLPFHDYPWMVANDPSLVVVAINYRLNVFGFMTTGTDKLPGNNGLRDQIVALRWIKANIGSFGGDPSKVVVWGQSAGAVAIGYHMMSHQSGDSLFRRAIMESGNALLPLTLAKPSYRQAGFLEFVRKLNCTPGGQPSGGNAKWIDEHLTRQLLPCLRAVSSEKLLEVYRQFAVHSPLAFLPNAEDRSLFAFNSFWKGIRNGAFSFTGDILIGTNEAEGAQYVKIGPLESFYSHEEISSNFTRANVLTKLSTFVPESFRSMVEPVVDMLMDGIQDGNNSTQLWQRYVELVGDMVFVCPDYFFIKGYCSRIGSRRPNRRLPPLANVFYYRFRPLVSRPFDCPRWSLGACHTDELQFVFGNPLLLKSIYPPTEQKLTHAIFDSWMHFAHHGSLTGGTNVSFTHWAPFTGDNEQYLEIELESSRMVKSFPGQRCEELCGPLYETLESIDDSQMKLIKTK